MNADEMVMDETLAEVCRIKEKCSAEYLARTPEERKQHATEVIKRAGERLGKPIRKLSLSATVR